MTNFKYFYSLTQCDLLGMQFYSFPTICIKCLSFITVLKRFIETIKIAFPYLCYR